MDLPFRNRLPSNNLALFSVLPPRSLLCLLLIVHQMLW